MLRKCSNNTFVLAVFSSALLGISLPLSVMAQVGSPSPNPRFSDTEIVGGTSTAMPKIVPTADSTKTDQHAEKFVGTWILSRPDRSGEITLNRDGSILDATDVLGIKEAEEKTRAMDPRTTTKYTFKPPRWKNEEDKLLIRYSSVEQVDHSVQQAYGITVTNHSEYKSEIWVYLTGDSRGQMKSVESRMHLTLQNCYSIANGMRNDLPGMDRDDKLDFPGISLTRKQPMPTPQVTPSDMLTAGKNIVDGGQKIVDSPSKVDNYMAKVKALNELAESKPSLNDLASKLQFWRKLGDLGSNFISPDAAYDYYTGELTNIAVDRLQAWDQQLNSFDNQLEMFEANTYGRQPTADSGSFESLMDNLLPEEIADYYTNRVEQIRASQGDRAAKAEEARLHNEIRNSYNGLKSLRAMKKAVSDTMAKHGK